LMCSTWAENDFERSHFCSQIKMQSDLNFPIE